MTNDQNSDVSPAPTGDPGSASSGDDRAPNEERTMAMLCHLLAIFTWFVGPLIIWLMKKDTSPFVNDQGKESLNFQITIGIGYVAMMILACITLGLGAILFPVLGVVNLVFCIIACVKANQGIRYRYPFAIRLLK